MCLEVKGTTDVFKGENETSIVQVVYLDVGMQQISCCIGRVQSDKKCTTDIFRSQNTWNMIDENMKMIDLFRSPIPTSKVGIIYQEVKMQLSRTELCICRLRCNE